MFIQNLIDSNVSFSEDFINIFKPSLKKYILKTSTMIEELGIDYKNLSDWAKRNNLNFGAREESGWRKYAPDDFIKLQLTVTLRNLFSIDEIKKLLAFLSSSSIVFETKSSTSSPKKQNLSVLEYCILATYRGCKVMLLINEDRIILFNDSTVPNYTTLTSPYSTVLRFYEYVQKMLNIMYETDTDFKRLRSQISNHKLVKAD